MRLFETKVRISARGRSAVFFLLSYLLGCGDSNFFEQSTLIYSIPKQKDWVDYGLIFEAGALGEWDYQLWGGFTATAVKKTDTYYLYYQGASGYRSTGDETVTWRAIGVATSRDGINFTKFKNNPIITWFPNNGGEEGAVSGAALLGDNGEIVLYYGANTEDGPTTVTADGRLAISADGFNFTDHGVVLDHQNGSLWGSGNELFPIIAFHDSDHWFVYYLPNETSQQRKLGVAWGNSRNHLDNSSSVQSGFFSTISAWGMGGYAKVGTATYALLLKDATKPELEVRLVSPDAPYRVSRPVETYKFDEVQQAAVLLDQDTNTWFMYYRTSGGYGVKMAPAGEPDTSPPSASEKVIAVPMSERRIDLSWSPATDPETGIACYKVFRDGAHLATVKGWHFRDTGLVEQTRYHYQISAINYHGSEGLRSVPVAAASLTDKTAPRVVSVNASGDPSQVTVSFDEPLDRESAEISGNYAINKGVIVQEASLNADLRTVTLATSAHDDDTTYIIKIINLVDQAETSNPMPADTEIEYLYSDFAGLVGAWTFDEGTGDVAFDKANFYNDGSLIYSDKPGPSWVTGKIGGALKFDGIDDQVTVNGSKSLKEVTDRSYTFTAWVYPDHLPLNTTVNNADYSVITRDYTGLYYDSHGRYRAQIRMSDGAEVVVTSEVFEPGRWHHLAMAVDDTNKKLHLYVDGREVSSSPVSYTRTLDDLTDAPFYIGTSDPLTERYENRFKGKIDEVRIYKMALKPKIYR